MCHECRYHTMQIAVAHAGEELFTCYKASTSACSESDLEDRLIRWGFPLPQPKPSQGMPLMSYLAHAY
jgi:hypothetical protein